MLLYFNHLHPSTPSQRPEKPGPACYNANRKSERTNVLTNRKSQGTSVLTNRKSQRTSVPTKEEPQKVGTAKALTSSGGETRGGARLQTCRVAIRGDMSWRHDHSPTSAPSQPSLDLSGGNAVRSHPRTHAECDSHPRTHAERDGQPRNTRILRIGPVFVGGTDTPIGQPSQLKPLKTKALSSDTGRASPANHRKHLYMRHSATFCDIS